MDGLTAVPPVARPRLGRMVRIAIGLVATAGILVIASAGGVWTGERRGAEPTGGRPTCVSCHRGLHPLLIASHEGGPHAAKARCEDCHGTDHDAMFSVDGEVSSAQCGKCHEKAYAEFRRSRHGQLLREGKMQDVLVSHAVSVAGCQATNGCHSVQRQNADGSVGQCSACHPAHGFSRREARDPAICARCHDGPDLPAWRVWSNDKHGVLHRADPEAGTAPSCATCHMPGGSHDDGVGLTRSVMEAPGRPQPTLVVPVTREAFRKAREEMVKTCLPCHGKRLAEETLNEADAARKDGLLLVEEAAQIVRDLHAEGLLVPAVGDRPPNPVADGQLVLGGKQIFDEHASRAERLFYEMVMFHWPDLWRSVFHTDSDLVRWYGRERLKTDLIEIRAEAERLRRR